MPAVRWGHGGNREIDRWKKSNIDRPDESRTNESFPKLDAVKCYSRKVKEKGEEEQLVTSERGSVSYSCVPRQCWDSCSVSHLTVPLSQRDRQSMRLLLSLSARHQKCSSRLVVVRLRARTISEICNCVPTYLFVGKYLVSMLNVP